MPISFVDPAEEHRIGAARAPMLGKLETVMIARPTDTDVLRAWLAGRDLPCPVCRYNLRDCAGESCPECGARLDLRVGSIDLKLGPWLLGVFALAIPLGFTGILAVVAAVGSQRAFTWSAMDWVALGVLWMLTLVYAAGLWLLCRRRAKALKRTRRAQWVRACLLVALMAALQVVIITLMSRMT
ncbi:MAG: hypothetical protein ACYTGG_06755 [Planctomycetota bacterium]|jgi:hypothetical protein